MTHKFKLSEEKCFIFYDSLKVLMKGEYLFRQQGSTQQQNERYKNLPSMPTLMPL